MKLNRFSIPEHQFILKFYEQTAEAVIAVVDAALRSHPGICGWTQAADRSGKKLGIAVTLQFRDKTAFEGFLRDEAFVDTYLASAWGRRALSRESLVVKPTREERGTIPTDMFGAVGI